MPNIHELEKVEAASKAALQAWFEENHAQTESVWLVTFKKSVPGKYLSTQDVLDALIAFGWIDGRRMKLDENRTMQLISPRKAQHWSKTYKDRAARLIEEGRMHAAGFESIERAKANGMWHFMDEVDALRVPDDLAAAFEQHPPALTHYKAFPDSAKRDILRWIKLAKRPETRQKRILESATLAAQNKRASGTK